MAKSRIRSAKNRSDQSELPPPYALPIPAALVDLVLLGPADDRRQLQDSPVLGDVWMEFAANAASVQDLLATPHKRSTAGDVADLVADWLDKVRTPANAPSHTHDVAYLQGLVAMQVDLVEMLQVVVPMTHWWTERRITKVLGGCTRADYRRKLYGVFKSIETQASGEHQYVEIPPVDRFLALAGLLLWAQSSKNLASIPRTPKPAAKLLAMVLDDIDTVRDALWAVYRGLKHRRPGPCDDVIFSLSLNRRVAPAIARSVPAAKGDAARMLFKVNTSKILTADATGHLIELGDAISF